VRQAACRAKELTHYVHKVVPSAKDSCIKFGRNSKSGTFETNCHHKHSSGHHRLTSTATSLIICNLKSPRNGEMASAPVLDIVGQPPTISTALLCFVTGPQAPSQISSSLTIITLRFARSDSLIFFSTFRLFLPTYLLLQLQPSHAPFHQHPVQLDVDIFKSHLIFITFFNVRTQTNYQTRALNPSHWRQAQIFH